MTYNLTGGIMFHRTLLSSIVCGLIVFAVQPRIAVAATASLTGSWQFTLSSTSAADTIPGLATFTDTGSVVETDGTEFVAPSSTGSLTSGSPGHGVWGPGGTPISFFVQYISLVLNPDGTLYAKHVTTMIVSPNSTNTTFTGTYVTNQVIGTQTTKIASGVVSAQLIPYTPIP